MNNYPEGQAERAEGVYEWSTSDNDTMGIRGAQLVINTVHYEGIATLRRQADQSGQFDVMFGDLYFHRLNGDHKEPTQTAYKVFQRRVVEIARLVDTEELRHATKLAVLREELDDGDRAIAGLKEDIEENEDRIAEIKGELVNLGEDVR